MVRANIHGVFCTYKTLRDGSRKSYWYHRHIYGSDDPVKLHFHDLRGTAITMLSEASCTPQQIATITGHSLKTVHRILERYLARTRGLAEQAILNFENSPRTKFANQLQTVRRIIVRPKGNRYE